MNGLVGPPHPEVLEEEVDEEVLLLDARSDKYYSLNSTAGDVWRLADGEMTRDGILTTLALAYGIDASEIRDDVEQAIDGFVAAGLLVRAET